jgi:hypothetical protein
MEKNLHELVLLRDRNIAISISRRRNKTLGSDIHGGTKLE